VARDYLTVAGVLGMHAALMQRYGGAPGARDPGALEAALFRPQTGYYEDIVAEAAALMESLAINHPLADGRKRIAFAATDVFLRINDWHLRRPPMQIYSEMRRSFGYSACCRRTNHEPGHHAPLECNRPPRRGMADLPTRCHEHPHSRWPDSAVRVYVRGRSQDAQAVPRGRIAFA
jgi:death-on-curing protein